jgi:hypothetical protein
MAVFGRFILKRLAVDYENRILLFDRAGIFERSGARQAVFQKGFEVFEYNDPEEFRFLYESKLRDKDGLKAIIWVKDPDLFVPYDIRKGYYKVVLDYSALFPKLDAAELYKARHIDHDMLYTAYRNYYGGNLGAKGTRDFIKNQVYTEENANELVDILKARIESRLAGEMGYRDWFGIAGDYARIKMMVDGGFATIGIEGLAEAIDRTFKKWMMEHYKNLSGSASTGSPVMVHRINDYMRARSGKIALVLIDGMSVENWLTIAAHLTGFERDFELGYSFAMVPTTTAVSRQSVFSGSLPVSHSDCFSLKHEEKQWRQYWQNSGYAGGDIYFGKGIRPDIPYNVRVAGIVVSFIDDLMHGQVQGQSGMYRDIASWAEGGDLKCLIEGLASRGFDVYITSDHGNIEAKGQGKPGNEGLLTEMTCLRARVYNEFAQTDRTEERHRVFEYPGTYMPKEYRYLICKGDTAFGIKGKRYVCHGGMSIEEIIVPFITVKDVDIK